MQNKQNYFVYFYKKDCPYCKKIEKDIIKFSSNKKNKVYFVDVSQHKKDIIQYDWVDFHTNNDIEIGKLTKSGKVKYYKEFSKNYFKNNKIKNKFDKTVEVKIITADKEYKKQNKNAKSGYVYASIQTPEIDYSIKFLYLSYFYPPHLFYVYGRFKGIINLINNVIRLIIF